MCTTPVAIAGSNAIKKHTCNEEILAVLKEVPNPNQEEDDDRGYSFNPLKIDVFLQTLLHLAAKSFSHSFSALANPVKLPDCPAPTVPHQLLPMF
ncbi:hypothetical protein COCON_G00108790 [Conger conger]|uniref:MIF4G-like type 2 domain-containing protein n=1 Tax=Conger conger TaxID=82655 RepID=A0A9Q1DJ64_CONCO|nr:hypothetical protein COCON_G00108790 [Conger conger]